MWQHLVLGVFTSLVIGIQAYSPIQWAKFPSRDFVIAPKSFSANGLVSSPSLTITDQLGGESAESIPFFTAKPDGTISWDGTDWCIEAGGASRRMVRVSRCSGGADQKWSLVPQGRGRRMIQLKDTNRCLHVVDKEGSLNGASIELRECSRTAADSWKFDEAMISSSARPSLHAGQFSSLSQWNLSLFMPLILLAVGLQAWLWRWRVTAIAEVTTLSASPSTMDQARPEAEALASATKPVVSKKATPLSPSYDTTSNIQMQHSSFVKSPVEHRFASARLPQPCMVLDQIKDFLATSTDQVKDLLATSTNLATSTGNQTVSIGTLRVPKMGMGTLNWPLDKTTDPNAAAALQACVDAGVMFFDTAEAYGFGKSEELLKDCVQKSGAPVILATKFAPVPWRQDPSKVVDAARESAKRLGVDAIDLYQIHFPDIIQPFKPFGLERRKEEEYWEGIAMAYEQGIIKNVGVSNYGPKLLQRAMDYLGKRGIRIVSNQINYSLLYRKESQATVDFCRENNITVLGYFPLANGLLAGKYSAENLPKFPKSLTMKKYIVGGVTQGGVTYPEGGAMPLINEMRRIADSRGKTVAQIALNYVMAKGVIPIPGCRDAKMAADNCGALGWLLNDNEVRALENAADSIGFEFSNGGFKLE